MAIGIVTHAPVENSTLFIESWSRTLFTELAQSDTPEKPAGNVDGKNCVAFSVKLFKTKAQSHYCGLAFWRQNVCV